MADETGQEHYPGWTMDTLKFLIEERGVAAVGHEPFDTDAAVGSAAAGDIQCERYVLAQDKFQIEVMDNLDQVPPTGAIIFVAFPRIMISLLQLRSSYWPYRCILPSTGSVSRQVLPE